MLGMDCFDDTTFQPARIMFWPACASDGEIFKHHNQGLFLDVEGIFTPYYSDWTDFAEWPHSSRVKAIHPSTQKAEDPLTKQGIIGAFNRTFDIHAAITRFDLPYESTDHDNRYRPFGASGPSGAVVYDDVFLYSHHESDVVGQQNVNAWDLVRLHKFGEQDSGNLDGVPVMRWPSSKSMAALALSIPMVDMELKVSPDEMKEIVDADSHDRVPVGAKAQSDINDLTFENLLDEISEINKDAKNIHELCRNRIQRIAAARLDATENSVLAAALREKYPLKPPKASIECDIKVTGKRLTAQLSDGAGGITDIEQDLIQAMLDEHYHKGRTIKRIGRKFWTYEKGLWALHDEESIDGKMIKTLTRLRKERPEDVLQLVASVGEAKTSTLMFQLGRMFRGYLAEREKRDDPLGLMRTYPLPIINCRNAELWFDIEGTMEKRKHNPDNFFTIRVDTKYNSKATCPEWDRFMQMIFSNSSDSEDMIRHLEELGGYVIQYSRWLKTWILFHGPKDTGKSTIAEVLKALLGSAFIGMEMAAFGKGKSDFAEQGLIGKLALVDDDYDKSNALPDGFVKKISEEKSMTTQIKFGDNLQFIARSLPMVLSNHWPITRDVSDAFRERALVFPFTYRIAGAHKSDERRNLMMQELPGILNRFIAGLIRLRARGDWDVPMDCYEARVEWEIKSNPARLFVAECVEMGTGKEHIRATLLWDAYVQWSRIQRSTDTSMRGLSKAEFFERMDSLLGDRVPRGKRPLNTISLIIFFMIFLQSLLMRLWRWRVSHRHSILHEYVLP
jgi:P4 family phage/plasmid primase-like protien